MPKARKSQISLMDTPYYHCVSRCVRRGFLCGEDPYTGKTYEHRRSWVEERLLYLAQIFAIDVCAYAVMSNHTHVVLHVNQSQAKSWSQQEVIERWHQFHKGTFLTRKWLEPEKRAEMCNAELNMVESTAKIWRERLYSISWFMSSLNEHIAREANKEDGCTGRFWEGRFKSQALLDEAALMACMAYVDLNPVRAQMAETPEQSDYTSLKKRAAKAKSSKQPKKLFPFVGTPRKEMPSGLPFKLKDYLQLVDVTGRMQRPDKRGSIPIHTNPIIQRLGLSEENWLTLACEFEGKFSGAVGKEHLLRQFHQHIGQKRTSGLHQSQQWFGKQASRN